MSWNQEGHEKIDREYWSSLKEHSKNNNWADFYELYAEYLAWANIYSERREILYVAAQQAAMLFKKEKGSALQTDTV